MVRLTEDHRGQAIALLMQGQRQQQVALQFGVNLSTIERFVRRLRETERRLIGLGQDNARTHVARVCQDFLANNNIQTLDWPPYSPDLSPIEHLWDELDRRNSKREEEKNEHNTSLSRKKYREEIKQHNGDVQLTRYSKLPMEEIANKLTVDKKDDINVKLNNDLQSNVKVSQMAEILVSKFKQGLEPPVKQKVKTTGVLLAAQPESEICYFCKKRVYIMERMCAEGIFFHRGCLKCDFCECGLRVNNYSCDKLAGSEVKFYCFRHSKPEMRLGRAKRKRAFEEDTSK
ncbi:protein-methionine sulfoxide oxidase mical3a-like, partial [Saccostrea cucullata]|uniref:protein-methionine sulfoxide oxidase mical3a-like n=1 Tax=Saccostrea cuccullata TaxID=36930 RepID=UPI002ED43D4A